MEKRQASVEVTPEMLKAGARAIWDVLSDVIPYGSMSDVIPYGSSAAPTLALEVFRAMCPNVMIKPLQPHEHTSPEYQLVSRTIQIL